MYGKLSGTLTESTANTATADLRNTAGLWVGYCPNIARNVGFVGD
jgi:hypothetical protein